MNPTFSPLLSLRACARFGVALLVGLLAVGLAGCCTTPPTPAKPKTYSSFDVPTHRIGETNFALGTITLQNADLDQVLAIYQEISGRTVVRGTTLPHPTITVRNQTPLTRVEALQLLDTALAENGIAMVLAGDTAVKAVPQAAAATEAPPEITLPWEMLPESGSFMMRTVHLERVRPSEVIPVLMPFVKAPNALLPIDADNLLIIRDYSSNVRQMLKLLQKVEQGAKP
jgi:type II secretory pathway component GspD/PulD (secretin)